MQLRNVKCGIIKLKTFKQYLLTNVGILHTKFLYFCCRTNQQNFLTSHILRRQFFYITKTIILPKANTLQTQKVGKFNITSLYTAVLSQFSNFRYFSITSHSQRPLSALMKRVFCVHYRRLLINFAANQKKFALGIIRHKGLLEN